jgi:DNA-binding NarL/FixJ family response regulator
MDNPDRYDSIRRPWREGPEEGPPAASWLGLGEDELLLKIETIGSQHDVDERLLEVVASDRHFFIRQEAAKRIRRKKLLFPYEDDRHIGQILVRHLNRREDLTYLERLVARSTHGEVRKAAQVQLGRVRSRLSDQDRREGIRQVQGKPSWRVAVVHDDPSLRQIVSDTLRAPEYEVMGHDVADAAAAIAAFDPHLLLAAADDLQGSGLHAAIRGRDGPLPIVALCDGQAAGRLPEMVGRGVDEYMLLPLQPELLAAKVLALLNLAHLVPRRLERGNASGAIGDEGVLPLLKLCEEEQLTCRLVVATPDARWFADFVGGEMTEAGGSPAVSDAEALAAILAARSGTYEMIEALPVDEVDPVRPVEPASSAMSSVQSASTELRAADAGWRTPDVDATLLSWAIHFIVEQAWTHLGTAATAGLLRRTLHEGRERHPTLAAFTIEANAHVGIDLSQGARMPAEAVGATAQWMAVFVAAVRRVAPDAVSIDVRDATRIVGAALERVDFYAAYDRAAVRKDPNATSHVIGRIIPTRRSE